jgi:hypothetical protein
MELQFPGITKMARQAALGQRRTSFGIVLDQHQFVERGWSVSE